MIEKRISKDFIQQYCLSILQNKIANIKNKDNSLTSILKTQIVCSKSVYLVVGTHGDLRQLLAVNKTSKT